MNKTMMRIATFLLAVLLAFSGLFAGAAPQKAFAESGLMQESEFKLLKVGTGGYAVRQMQTVLQELGFYDGPISGNFSRDFEQAVKDFQKDFNVEVTGKIDYELYTLLYEEFSSFPQETAQPKATQKPKPTEKPTEKPKEDKKDDFWSLLFGSDEDEEIQVEKNGTYTDKDHVAAYLKEYGELPSNYITKNEARKLGWNGSRSGLWDVAWGMSIGGDKFGNYEEILPVKRGRQYYECDIDFDGRKANAKRIVYSNDGLIFYTDDHYETFEEIK